MSEIVKSKDDRTQYAKQLRELLMERDELKKEIRAIRMEYVRIFGEERLEEFSLQVRAVRLKKEIAWIVRRLNTNEAVDPDQMKDEIDQVMSSYETQLSNMAGEYAAVKEAEEVSEEDARKIRQIYHRIAKSIHPDLHPELAGNEDAQLLWHAVSLAYELNDLEELENLETQLLILLPEHSEAGLSDFEFSFDPRKRLIRIQDQIDDLLKDPVFELREWIETEEGRRQRKALFEKSILKLQAYLELLEEQKEMLMERSRSCQMH